VSSSAWWARIVRAETNACKVCLTQQPYRPDRSGEDADATADPANLVQSPASRREAIKSGRLQVVCKRGGYLFSPGNPTSTAPIGVAPHVFLEPKVNILFSTGQRGLPETDWRHPNHALLIGPAITRKLLRLNRFKMEQLLTIAIDVATDWMPHTPKASCTATSSLRTSSSPSAATPRSSTLAWPRSIRLKRDGQR
jgi:hypothetical protein